MILKIIHSYNEIKNPQFVIYDNIDKFEELGWYPVRFSSGGYSVEPVSSENAKPTLENFKRKLRDTVISYLPTNSNNNQDNKIVNVHFATTVRNGVEQFIAFEVAFLMTDQRENIEVYR